MAEPMPEFSAAEELVVQMYRRGDGLPPEQQIISIGTNKILSSGIWSPYLLNLRLALSHNPMAPVSLRAQRHNTGQMLDAYVDRVEQTGARTEGVDHIFGNPEAGTPLAAAVAARGGFSLLWQRVDESKKARGSHKELEGFYYVGQHVVQLDDAATSGATGLKGKEFLGGHHLSNEAMVVLLDREQGAADELGQENIQLNAAFGATAMFGYLREAGHLTQSQHDFLVGYTHGPLLLQEPADHPWKVNGRG